MPLQSKRTVKVHEIPVGTTKDQYLDFVKHLCTKPKKSSGFRLSLASHFEGICKPKPALQTSIDEAEQQSVSKDETGPPSTSKDEANPPSTLRGEAEPTASLLESQGEISQLIEKGWTERSFCLQNGYPVGTVSFSNETLKNKALARHKKDKKSGWKDWTVEDNFKGITILYEAPDAKVDICAVHGLGGNAIDTWTANNGRMWLIDFLPVSNHFKGSRIMTFGFDSDLTDRSTVMELENWAETLLLSLNEVRTTDKEKTRPLLFVSHSLGGLVVRKAMARLHLTPNCNNITLSLCGIVFLATPHSGSTKADWNNFLVAAAHVIGGVRPETVRTLQSFNTASVWDTTAFLQLRPCPPFRCFAEGLRMPVKGTLQHIVTQASAMLGENQAHMIMDVDHSSICKFRSKQGAYVTISQALLGLFEKVTASGGPQQARRMFGQPRFLAHAYPPHRGFWWEGNELNDIQHQLMTTRPFFGRSEELKTLEASLTTDGTRPKLTVIKGIAGIGKTDLLLQFAATQRGCRNVFFLGSHDKETIDSVLSKLSTRIGFDMIDNPAVNQERWRTTPVSERIQIFTAWLGDACNKESLFIIDDIEAFGYPKISTILKYPAHHALVSTRDSNLMRTDRDFQEFRLSPLNNEDTIGVLQDTLKRLSWKGVSRTELNSIAHRIRGHPLAARNAIPFIMEHLSTYESPTAAFLDLFESHDPEERKLFLEFSFEGRSLWGAFDTSLERLGLQESSDSAIKLIQVLPLLRSDRDCMDDVLKMDKRWLRECEQELPDIAVLKSGYAVISKWLSKLRGVSFYVWSDSFSLAKSLNIHPLMLQYMLLNMDEQTRTSLMRQVLQLCYKLEDRGADRETQVKPHVLQCVQVCQGLGVSLISLGLPEGIMQWVEGFLEEQEEVQEVEEVEESPFADPIELTSAIVVEFIKICMETNEKLQGCGSSMPEESTTYKMMVDCTMSYKEMRRRIGVHEGIPDSLKPTLVDAITVLQEMVRLRNIYPKLISDLEVFRKGLIDG
ncbi:hypothetical protein DER44DRAFT_707818 [Fusarium oxysporum]|nr:hypothetical protein DER44DRAFT_707818 [Fusarium oxysporum]